MRRAEKQTFPERVKPRDSGQKRQRAMARTSLENRLVIAGIDAKRRMGWTLPNRRARRKYALALDPDARALAYTLGKFHR